MPENYLNNQLVHILMGAILSSRIKDDGKVIFEIAVDYEESMQLKGNMQNVHIFSESAGSIESKISQRGKREATKYFLIPKELRESLNLSAKTSCQRLDTKTKAVFIYVVDKLGF